MTDTAYSRVIDTLRDLGPVAEHNGAARTKCPAHNGNSSTSLAIRPIDGSVLIYCHAGCQTADVLAAIKMSMRDLFDDRNGARYVYPDERRVHRTPGKTFYQKGNTEGRDLFHGDRIGDASTVYIVEGEKDVLAIEAVGGAAVCSAMGAGKAHKADWSVLKGKDAVIIADKDKPGRGHATQVAGLLDGIAASVQIVEAKTGKDAADHIAAGHGLNEFAAQPSLLDQRAVNGDWLEAQHFADLEYTVDGIIPEGLGIFVGPPKKGKSFFVADIGLAVAAGATALGCIKVTQRPVLYLALEDGHRRLKDRFHRILDGQPIPAGIEVVIKASPGEAIAVIAEYLKRHADQKPLVILDTLGKVKPAKRAGEDSYQVDYAIGSRLKELADAVPGATLLVVHHTRKAESVDFVDSVSGTQGIAGSVDFVMVLDRKRHSDDAVLSVTGRDVVEAEYALHADGGILWRLDGTNLAAARDTVDKRRDLEKMGDRMMEVYLFVHKAADAVTATTVAKNLDGVDGETAGTYLRRLERRGYIAKLGRGQYMKNVSGVSVSGETAGQSTRETDKIPYTPVSGVYVSPPPLTETDTSDKKDTSHTTDTTDRNTHTERTGYRRPDCVCIGQPKPCHYCKLAASRSADTAEATP